ncbi:MAG: adenylyltransferase/cytidyltransferase family protein [Candidatus Dependentiae bacterium]
MHTYKKLLLVLNFIICPIHATHPIRVYVDMVADLFHFGHVQFLKQAKAHGDYLIVGLTADEDVARYKRTPILNVEERAQSVSGCKYVDEVIPNCPYCITKEFIEEHNIDLVIHGDDMSKANLDYFYAVPISMGIFKTVPYTETISTTDLLTRIFDRGRENLLKK